MTRLAFPHRLGLSFACLLAAHASAWAAGPHDCPFAHPATRSACSQPAGIDANAFRVQPPASVRWLADGGAESAVHHGARQVRAHGANGEHPAVIVARRQARGIDANAFLVQPPAQVSWTVQTQDTRLATLSAAPLH